MELEGTKFREMDGEREKRGRDTGIQRYEGKKGDTELMSRYMNGSALHIVHQRHCAHEACCLVMFALTQN